MKMLHVIVVDNSDEMYETDTGHCVEYEDYASLRASHGELLKIVRMMSLRSTVPPLKEITEVIARAKKYYD